MKIKALILLPILISLLVSCEKDMKWINSGDSKIDQKETDKICQDAKAECGYIVSNYNGVSFEMFCGKCKEGYDCNSDNRCTDIDECADPSLNKCSSNTICANEEGTYSCICKENYSGKDCVPDTRLKDCENLPENAEWNTVSEITQTWNGKEWVPTSIGSFNTSVSSSECRFKCYEHYSWKNSQCAADTKSVACSGLPENAEWNTVSEITQTWDGSDWTPSNKEYYDEKASLTECRYKCKTNYIWEESKCVASTQTVSCTGLPEHAEWNSVSSITQTWNGSAWSPSRKGIFNEEASEKECRFKCNEHYNYNASTSTCDADTITINCPDKPAYSTWNDNGANGTFTQMWNGEAWESENYTTEYSKTAGTCKFKCNENYTYNQSTSTCDADSRTANCTAKPNYSTWNDNGHNGTFTQVWNGDEWIPATYTSSHGDTTDICVFKCNTNYSYNVSTLTCDADKQQIKCPEKPANSIWNDDGANGEFTQTWSGSAWTPAIYNSEYNETAGTCRYKCNTDYHWENSACVSNTKTNITCSGLPTNAQWNTASSITQTWNGSEWIPTTTGSYNTTESSSECRYKCKTNYNWNSSSKTCVAATRTGTCTGLPTNAQWNTVSSITQTWNGSGWSPTTVGIFNKNSSSQYCRFKCKNGYMWDQNQNYCKKITLANICTGKNICYSGSSTTDCASSSYFGQDAYYAQANTCIHKDFSSTSDTIIDNNLALEWQKTIPESTFTWSAANSYCENLTYGDYDDWRLPKLQELISIVNLGRENPAVDTSYFSSITSASFWSASTKDSYAWFIQFTDGTYGYDSKNNSNKVVCVRSDEPPLPDSDFSLLQNAGATIIRENSSGLIWRQSDSYSNWGTALSECENLTYAGYSDWRLPNKNELISIINFSKSAPASDFPDIQSNTYWTSTPLGITSSGGCSGDYGDYLNIASILLSSGKDDENSEDDGSYFICVRNDSCKQGYVMDNGSCKLEENRIENCSSLPANAVWNSVSAIKQTKINSTWFPSTEATYNTTSSIYECRFKCAANYFWDGSSCLNPCDPNPCSNKTHSTKICTAKNLSVYSCGCDDGYSWNAGECRALSTGLTLGEICTGQDKCYNTASSEGEITCPASGEDFSGQDTQYSEKCAAHNFQIATASGQYVVNDKNTKLMWQRDFPTTTKTWADAWSYCETSTYGGYSDWRLPNPQELLTIVDSGKYNPAFDSTYFPSIAGNGTTYFWSSKTDAQNYVFYAESSGALYTSQETSKGTAICVRGAELPNSSFTLKTIGEDIVTEDSITGLMWQKTYETDKTWQEALQYCEKLSYAGYADWRLPNKNELASLLNHDRSEDPYSDFPDMPSHGFWSSSTSLGSTNYAWYSYFSSGKVVSKSKTGSNSARCVR